MYGQDELETIGIIVINIFSVLVDIYCITRQYYWCRYQSSSKILNSIYWIIISKIRTFSSKMKFLSKEKKRMMIPHFFLIFLLLLSCPLSLSLPTSISPYLLFSALSSLLSRTVSFDWSQTAGNITWFFEWLLDSLSFLYHREFRHILLYHHRQHY